MTKALTSAERATRIELLQARAAIERHELLRGVRHVRTSLTPRALLKEALPVFGGGRSSIDLLLRAVGFLRRYPFLLSGASAVLGGRRARSRWVKLAASLLIGWQVSRRLKRLA